VDFTWWYQNITQLDSDPTLSIQTLTVEINDGVL